MRQLLRRAAALAAAVLATLGLLELGARVAVERGLLRGVPPASRYAHYWWGGHPVFGVWRRPNAEIQATTPCFDVTYRTNSVGARDAERPREATGPRVVVLGDSFLAGWGLEIDQRLSNRLEAETGVPHLNFAMDHFGPYQSFLAYHELARGYAHDAVLFGILPANDFRDLDFVLAERMGAYEYRYRPYLVGDPPEFVPFDYREAGWSRFLRYHSWLWNALLVARKPTGSGILSATPEEIERLPPDARRAPSWFYDYGDRQVQLLEAVLERLARDAQGKRVAVLLLPTLWDFPRLALSGSDPLAERLRPVTDRLGFQLVDLLPAMAAARPDPRIYTLSCDYHWTSEANAVAAELVREALGPGFFGARP